MYGWRAPRLVSTRPSYKPSSTHILMAGNLRRKRHEFNMVLARHGRHAIAISVNEPRGTYADTDVDEIKEDSKRLRKELDLLRAVVRSDDEMSQLLTRLESQHEVGEGSGSGGGEDDESGADEDVGGDEEIYDMPLRSSFHLAAGDMSPGKVAHVGGDSWALVDLYPGDKSLGKTISGDVSPAMVLECRREPSECCSETMKKAAEGLGVSLSTLKRKHNKLEMCGWQGPDLMQRKAYNSKNQNSFQHTSHEDSPVEFTAPPPKSKPIRGCQKKMDQNDDAPRSTAWTYEEEITLGKGWIHVSKNNVVGNARRAFGFWTQVLRYQENKTKAPGRRTYDMVNEKWKSCARTWLGLGSVR
nr:hypothetical protein [Tanacetum cinerariifolium]